MSPMSTRDQLKREADQALNDMHRAIVNLQTMQEKYQAAHPELAEQLQVMVDMQELIASTLVQFQAERM